MPKLFSVMKSKSSRRFLQVKWVDFKTFVAKFKALDCLCVYCRVASVGNSEVTQISVANNEHCLLSSGYWCLQLSYLVTCEQGMSVHSHCTDWIKHILKVVLSKCLTLEVQNRIKRKQIIVRSRRYFTFYSFLDNLWGISCTNKLFSVNYHFEQQNLPINFLLSTFSVLFTLLKFSSVNSHRDGRWTVPVKVPIRFIKSFLIFNYQVRFGRWQNLRWCFSTQWKITKMTYLLSK